MIFEENEVPTISHFISNVRIEWIDGVFKSNLGPCLLCKWCHIKRTLASIPNVGIYCSKAGDSPIFQDFHYFPKCHYYEGPDIQEAKQVIYYQCHGQKPKW